MMGIVRGGGSFRYLLAFVVLGLFLLGACEALSFLPRPADGVRTGFNSISQFKAAYSRVIAGRTRASQLGRMGFDAAAPDAQALSYLGVMERFMPRDSAHFDRLDPAVRGCFEARDGCTAYIFRLGGKAGSTSMFDMFSPAAMAQQSAAQIVLLIRDGRVAYKAISGLPSLHAQIRRVTAQD